MAKMRLMVCVDTFDWRVCESVEGEVRGLGVGWELCKVSGMSIAFNSFKGASFNICAYRCSRVTTQRKSRTSTILSGTMPLTSNCT